MNKALTYLPLQFYCPFSLPSAPSGQRLMRRAFGTLSRSSQPPGITTHGQFRQTVCSRR